MRNATRFPQQLITLDSALQGIDPGQLALEELNASPEGPALAIADAAWTRLRESYPTVFDPLIPEIRREFCRYLVRRLERTGHPIFGRRASCDGRSISDVQSLSEALSEYKALARIWNAQLTGWCKFVTDFLTQAATFLHNHDCEQGLDTLVDLRTGLSDPHRGGRSVTRVRFRNAGDWFYKPRSGRREAAWSQLLDALNSVGFDPPFFIPEVRPGSGHCWMRAISHVECRGDDGRRRFYYRTGSILYLAHILRAVDLHAANFVIHGEHPVLIDSETLFHPETDVPPAARINERSLARTGMLSPYDSANGNPFIDLRRERLATIQTSARACPQGRDSDEVLNGFEAMHEFLHQAGKHRHIKSAFGRLRWSGTRCLLRPTHLYYHLIQEALTPLRLRSMTDLYRFLRFRLEDGLCKTSIVRKEIRQLLSGDIPTFNVRPAFARYPLSKGDLGRAMRDLRHALQRN